MWSRASVTAITLKYIIRRAAGTPARWYGLENSNVNFEYVPLFTKFKAVNKMQRLAPKRAAVGADGLHGVGFRWTRLRPGEANMDARML